MRLVGNIKQPNDARFIGSDMSINWYNAQVIEASTPLGRRVVTYCGDDLYRLVSGVVVTAAELSDVRVIVDAEGRVVDDHSEIQLYNNALAKAWAKGHQAGWHNHKDGYRGNHPNVRKNPYEKDTLAD